MSTPSIYLHFADKDALIDAVCEAVFTDLGQAMELAAAAVDDPFESLKERGLAYVRFALANPEHYRIVLMSRGEEPYDARDLLATSTYHHLVESVRRCQAIGVFAADTDPIVISTSLWAAAHGIAALLISQPNLVPPDQQLAMADHVLSAAGLGIALMQRLPPPELAAHGAGRDLAALLDATMGTPQRS